MNICSLRSHEEIVYQGRYCPLCAALDEIVSLEDQILQLDNFHE